MRSPEEAAAERLSPGDRASLLEVARASVDHGLREQRPVPLEPERFAGLLRELGASFVTLRVEGSLRGCTGALEACRPLVEDVALHAFCSAFQDPRFPPLRAEERAGLEFHVAVLGPPEPLRFEDEAGLLAQLEPGVHGLVIQAAGRRATFLPAVWAQLPEPRAFLRALKEKAGLPREPDALRLYALRYVVEEFP